MANVATQPRKRGVLSTIGTTAELCSNLLDIGNINARAELAIQSKELITELIAVGYSKAEATAIIYNK